MAVEIISGVYTLQNQLQLPPTSSFYLQRIQPAPASHSHIQSAPTTPTSPIWVSFLYKTTSNHPQLLPTNPDQLQSPLTIPNYHSISRNQL